jgi:hypothetical protein
VEVDPTSEIFSSTPLLYAVRRSVAALKLLLIMWMAAATAAATGAAEVSRPHPWPFKGFRPPVANHWNAKKEWHFKRLPLF